jgi:hypothetical protein
VSSPRALPQYARGRPDTFFFSLKCSFDDFNIGSWRDLLKEFGRFIRKLIPSVMFGEQSTADRSLQLFQLFEIPALCSLKSQ